MAANSQNGVPATDQASGDGNDANVVVGANRRKRKSPVLAGGIHVS